jgi:FlaA1/EpsC-like NDP-sugar epimerase
MIRMAGLKPFEEMEITYTGLRPGEKLSEELEMSGEEFAKTRHPRIFIGQLARVPSDRVYTALARLESAAQDARGDKIRRILSEFLPEARLSFPARSQEESLSPEKREGEGPHAA